jgi:hypothetical protein
MIIPYLRLEHPGLGRLSLTMNSISIAYPVLPPIVVASLPSCLVQGGHARTRPTDWIDARSEELNRSRPFPRYNATDYRVRRGGFHIDQVPSHSLT